MTEMDTDDWKAFVNKHNYSHWTLDAENTWFFVEGRNNFEQGRYLPSLLCLLVGIEACLRTFYCYHRDHSLSHRHFEGILLSNTLLLDCKKDGLQVEVLAFPDESDFLQAIQHNTPHVSIVSLRNDICHGNTVQFHRGDTFHPDHARETTATVIELADALAVEMKRFASCN